MQGTPINTITTDHSKMLITITRTGSPKSKYFGYLLHKENNFHFPLYIKFYIKKQEHL